MNFQFLNSNPEFKLYQLPEIPNALFYYTGIFDQSLSSIVRTLDNGQFPENLKGNFAFVFCNENRVVGAVDHLPTTNLFYARTNDGFFVSHIYDEINSACHSPDFNWLVGQQTKFFWGGSIGTETYNYNVSRLEAGTCFDLNRISNEFNVRSYIDLNTHHIDSTITKGDIADIVEQIVEQNTRDQFNLLWSSGTDSNCLLGFIRKLNRIDRCNLLSLYSDTSVSDERPDCQYLASVYGLNPQYLNLGNYIGITREVVERAKALPTDHDFVINLRRTWDGFWFEPNVFQKYTALLDSDYTKFPTFTGEVGDQVFGSRFGKTITSLLAQRPNTTYKEISELFIRADSWRFRASSIVHEQAWQQNLNNNPTRLEAWTHAGDWCAKTWAKIDTGGDIINRTELLQYKYKGSHRVYNYSQLKNCSFVHPFADYRLFHVIFKTPGVWKINNGKTRRLSLDIIKDYVDPGPWNWAKSGIQLPTAHGFNPALNKEMMNVVRRRHQ